MAAFLRDKDFLVFSPSAYNTLGLGTTQLYNRTLVYNHKPTGRGDDYADLTGQPLMALYEGEPDAFALALAEAVSFLTGR